MLILQKKVLILFPGPSPITVLYSHDLFSASVDLPILGISSRWLVQHVAFVTEHHVFTVVP